MTHIRPPQRWLGLLGGTFDPVHEGHLHIAQHAYDALALDEVQFIPCHLPVHRGTPQASPAQRLDMLRLALEGCPHLSVNPLELERNTPSYTVDSLRALRQRYPQEGLIWLLGSDTFNTLATWGDYHALVHEAHLVILSRPGHPLSGAPWQRAYLEAHEAPSIEALKQQPAGYVYALPNPKHPAAATHIRQALPKQPDAATALPDAVKQYILRHGLYQV